MSLLHPRAGSRPQYDSAETQVVAPVRNDAFALLILIAYMVFMLPVLVLRVLVVSSWVGLVAKFRSPTSKQGDA